MTWFVKEMSVMFRFRMLKQNSAINVLEIKFTETQEDLLKQRLTENKEILDLLNKKMFDEYGRYISINDSIVQVFKTTIQTQNSVLFPRDKYTIIDNGVITYKSALSLQLVKNIQPLITLMEEAGMEVHYSRP